MFTCLFLKEKIGLKFIFSLIFLILFHVHVNAQTLSTKKQVQLNTKKLENHEKLLQTAFDSIKSFINQYSSVNTKIVEINSQLNSLERKQQNFYNQILIRLSQIEEYGDNEIPSLRNQIDNIEQTYKSNSKQNEKIFSNIDLKFINSENEIKSFIENNAFKLEEINIKLKKISEIEKNIINLSDQFSNIVDLNSLTFDNFNEKFKYYDEKLESNNDKNNVYMESFDNITNRIETLSNDLEVLSGFVSLIENSVSEASSSGIENFKTTNDIRDIEKDVLENLNDTREQKKLNTYR